jgi:probable F420-dependent oxidoreductase
MTDSDSAETAVGLALPQFGATVDRSALRDFCQSAEELGFASLWVQEHLFYPHAEGASDSDPHYQAGVGTSVYASPRYRSVLSPTETMMAAAAWTDRIRIGSSILVAGYHRPVDLAKRLATIDVLSDGRLIAGLSVGWSDAEHRQMDVDPKTRGRRCDEFVPALLACWAADPVSFEGDFFSIPLADVDPKPVQARVPLLSGMTSAAGKERTIQHFDIWEPLGEAQQMRRELDEMNERRPVGKSPLKLYQRVFLEMPGQDPEPAGVDGALQAVDRARDAGADGVTIEAGFWRGCASPKDWASLPAKLASAVTG